MKIGIDISQLAYSGTGVANYLENLVGAILRQDKKNQYVLFASSLRRNFQSQISTFKSINKNVEIKIFKFPPSLLDLLWNKLHILSIERLIGDVDVFISSDWTQPPMKKAKNVTILYDLIVYKYPEETHNQLEFDLKKMLLSPNIVQSQKRRLHWVKKESDMVFCISEATRKDAEQILGIKKERLTIVYPGVTL